MTKGQRITLMSDWWPAACRAQGWDKNDRDLRLRVLSEAVKRPIKSASDLDTREDIDAVKAYLGALTDNLDAAREVDDPTIGKARRLRSLILNQIVPCLSLYEPNPMGYVQTVITGLARWNTTDYPTRPPTLDDLDAKPIISERRQSPSQLDQAVMTLSARLNSKRKQAGDTIHDMRLRAGLECNCAQCARQRLAAAAQPSAPAVEANCPF